MMLGWTDQSENLDKWIFTMKGDRILKLRRYRRAGMCLEDWDQKQLSTEMKMENTFMKHLNCLPVKKKEKM